MHSNGRQNSGQTQQKGKLDCAQQAAAALDVTGGVAPTANADGSVDMVFHQGEPSLHVVRSSLTESHLLVNGDGAGPLTGMVSADVRNSLAFVDAADTAHDDRWAKLG